MQKFILRFTILKDSLRKINARARKRRTQELQFYCPVSMFDITQKQTVYNLISINIRIQNMLWKNDNNSEDKSRKLPPPPP